MSRLRGRSVEFVKSKGGNTVPNSCQVYKTYETHEESEWNGRAQDGDMIVKGRA